jgi:Xaa-Pro dipeptidase
MTFSVATYQDRLKKAKSVAASRGLAGLMLTRPSSIISVAGFVHASTSERPLYAVLPVDGDPFLIVPAIEYAHAKSKSWFKDVRRWYLDLPSREQPFKSLAGMLGQMEMAGKSIGVEDASVIAALQKEMPGTRLVNARDIVRDLRMIKSREEIDLMRNSARYADFALKVVAESVQEGITELEIETKAIQETISKMSKEVREIDGPRPVYVRVVSGPRTEFPHSFSTTSKLKRGDVVFTVVITSAYGYECGIIERTFFFGKPTEEQKKIYDIVLKGMGLAMEAMKPGATCSEVHRARNEYMTRSGYGDYVLTKSGGVRGLEGRDDVYLCDVDETILKPWMTFYVTSGMFIPGNNGYRVGEMVLITEKGCESLHRFPSGIESVIIGA